MDMEYEDLLRDAFQCGRWGDPFGLANADVYRHAIGSQDEEEKHRLIYGISAALKKVGNQSDPSNLDLTHALDDLDKKLWKDQSDKNIDSTIVAARKLFKQHGI
jgi:hypothetical protein